MSIVWIASYPKSGNTWVRFLLANYLAGPVRDSAEVERLIPDMERAGNPWSEVEGRPALMAKTHTVFDRQRCKELTDRSIYITRHPKDVLLSNLNYKHLIMRRGRRYTDEEYAHEFIDMGGDAQWLQHGFGTLAQHAESWLDRHPRPCLWVRYEDLKKDTPGQLRAIVKFLGHEAEPARIEAAVSASSFETMRAIEVRERRAAKSFTVFAGGALAVAAGRPRYFMHEGGSRRTLSHISPGLDREFDRRFAPLIERLGYGGGTEP